LATSDKVAISPPAVKYIAGKPEQQRIERDHQHLKGQTRSMRGFQTLPCAPVVCAGHGFMRNLRNGCYDLEVPEGKVNLPQSPRLVRAWDDLTLVLTAA